MKVNDIKIKSEQIEKYAEYENNMQAKVYPKRIQTGKLSTYQARLNYAIIAKLRILAKLLVKKGLTIDQLIKALEGTPNKAVEQGQLNFEPNPPKKES